MRPTAGAASPRACPRALLCRWLALALLAAFVGGCARPLGIAGDGGVAPQNNNNPLQHCSDLDLDGHPGLDPQWCPGGDDHCDWDPWNFTESGCHSCADVDGDGRGASCDLGPDCDEADPGCWDGACCDDECVDADGDGRGDGDACLGPDCNDHDPSCWAAGEPCCAQCELQDLDGDGYGLFATCNGMDCNDGDPTCSLAGSPCCQTGSLGCDAVVLCALDCGWPANPACAQSCYQSGTTAAQLRIEEIWRCAADAGCGAEPECIQNACPVEVASCLQPR